MLNDLWTVCSFVWKVSLSLSVSFFDIDILNPISFVCLFVWMCEIVNVYIYRPQFESIPKVVCAQKQWPHCFNKAIGGGSLRTWFWCVILLQKCQTIIFNKNDYLPNLSLSSKRLFFLVSSKWITFRMYVNDPKRNIFTTISISILISFVNPEYYSIHTPKKGKRFVCVCVCLRSKLLRHMHVKRLLVSVASVPIVDVICRCWYIKWGFYAV